MRPLSAISCCSLILGLAGAAYAQTPSVQFQIVERNGQVTIPNPVGATASTDAVLNFAVQARVIGGNTTDFLGNFSFDIVASGELDSRGTLAKLLTSNIDGTYTTNPTNASSATVGRGGLPAIYTYLAGINPNFNGLINTSGGTFSNTPGSQEIGLVTGSPTGNSLLLLTDTMGTGNPDTYPGSGTTAPIDPNIASLYLGAGANFVDVYRFKYTVSDLITLRSITFTLANVTAQIGNSLLLSNGVWGPVQANASTSSTGVSVFAGIFPSPSTAALFGLGGLIASRRNRPR